MCMCQQGGEFLGEVIEKGVTWLIFETCCAQGFDVVRVALVRGKSFTWGVSVLFLAPGFPRFPSTSSMTASSVTSVFEESCFGF